ncbi:hypothetical protein MC885_021314 [Smutsia gigantea]|nr:hypothetical protein MC885_021314 [Smutsia gigantea]
MPVQSAQHGTRTTVPLSGLPWAALVRPSPCTRWPPPCAATLDSPGPFQARTKQCSEPLKLIKVRGPRPHPSSEAVLVQTSPCSFLLSWGKDMSAGAAARLGDTKKMETRYHHLKPQHRRGAMGRWFYRATLDASCSPMPGGLQGLYRGHGLELGRRGTPCSQEEPFGSISWGAGLAGAGRPHEMLE